MLKISNIKLPVGHDQHALLLSITKKLRVPKEVVKRFEISKRSLDARKKPDLQFAYQVIVTIDPNQEKHILQAINKKKSRNKDIEPFVQPQEIPLRIGDEQMTYRPVVIGTGPAGLMAALSLAEQGYRPLVFERGQEVEQRLEAIEHFWESGELNTESNIQFGEGGAGTFSDGKLTTRIRDSRIDRVYQYFMEAGAPEEILYLNKPHIGTDKLRIVVKKLRQRLEELGGEVFFNHKLIEIDSKDQQVQGITVEAMDNIGNHDNNHKIKYISTHHLILAIGHSARDTYEMLYEKGVAMAAKSLAIGVRIEHPQAVINYSQYGRQADSSCCLGAAEYQLVRKKDQRCDRTVYSFCMCPGGMVVAAASEEFGVVTNGMSYHARDLENANSALVVTIDPEDYGYVPGSSPLLGIEYLRKWERLAYKLGGSNYHAPAQLVSDFLLGIPTETFSAVTPSYTPGVTGADLHHCLPDFVADALKHAIRDFGKRIDGFDAGNAVLTGVETRTSSPIRIHRSELGESLSTKGLYPTGEGAGYAGGIISAAVDGLRAAEHLMQKYAPCKKINDSR